jgi:dolichol-phosphate mannosyltransferase
VYKLSVIVPIYNGEKYIKKNLEIMKRSLSKIFERYEIIAVIDGTRDGSLKEVKKVKGIKIASYRNNRGKGYAIRYGCKYITGNIVTFIDSDMDLHPRLLKNFIPYLSTADIIIGSKRHPFSKIDYPFLRRVLSKLYQIFSKIVLGVGLSDTQSGIKLIKKEVLEVIFSLIQIDGFAFDVELCFLAQKHGFRVVEAPIHLNYQFNGSTIKLGSIIKMFFDTLSIRLRYSILKTYQKQFWKVFFSKE